MRPWLCFLVILLAGLHHWAAPAFAGQTHLIQVIRDAESGKPRFEPALLHIAPGDSVDIKMAGTVFSSRLIPGMHPPNAEFWWGQVGDTTSITLDQPGVYGHKCATMYSLGLVGLIVVGDPSGNLEAAQKVQHPPVADRILRNLLGLVQSPAEG